MSEPFLGEIRIVTFNFAPTGWAFCDGQLMSIAQNEELFNLIGTLYGGDGKSTFALPNLQGRVAIHQGTGTGLSDYSLGEFAGAETIALTTAQIPRHNHPLHATTTAHTSGVPTAHVLAGGGAYNNGPTNTQLNGTSVGVSGGSEPHDNLQPFLVLNFIIALQGVYPTQT
jgi:microcystin-dependent protein